MKARKHQPPLSIFFIPHFFLQTQSKQIGTMRVSSHAIALLTLLAATEGFAPSVSLSRKSVPLFANLHEFDYLLGEQAVHQQPRSRKALLPREQVKLTSSMIVTSEEALDDGYTDEDFMADSETVEADEYGEEVGKITTFQQKSSSNGVVEWIKQADLQEILWTLAVPAVVGTIAFRFVTGKVTTKLEGNADELLNSFANDMVYNDGDFEEMKLCQKDYAARLLWLGPKRNDAMLKTYLEMYAKKKTVTPKAIR